MQLVTSQKLAWVISYQPVIVSMVSFALVSLRERGSAISRLQRAATMIRKFIQLHLPR